MNGETSRIFASPRFFEEYDARTTERLKHSLDDRLALLRRSAERLEHLRVAAEAVEEAELVAEIDSYLELARTNVTTLEGLIQEVAERHAGELSVPKTGPAISRPPAAPAAPPVYVPPPPPAAPPAASEPAAPEPAAASPAPFEDIFQPPASTKAEPSSPAPSPVPEPPPAQPAPLPPQWPLPAWPLSPSPASQAPASDAGANIPPPVAAPAPAASWLEPALPAPIPPEAPASSQAAPANGAQEAPPDDAPSAPEDWSDLTSRVSTQFGGDPLAGLVDEKYSSPWVPAGGFAAAPQPSPAPNPPIAWDLGAAGAEEPLPPDKVPTEKILPETSHTLELEVWAGSRSFAWTMTRDSALVGRRSPDNRTRPDIDLWPDQAVSRRHLQISARDGRYFITDLGSVNGTEVNSQWIEPRVEVELRDGDEIMLGEHSRIRVRNLG